MRFWWFSEGKIYQISVVTGKKIQPAQLSNVETRFCITDRFNELWANFLRTSLQDVADKYHKAK